MFRTPYPVRIKVSIFNQSKIFNSLLLFSNDSRPSLFSSCSNFLVNPLPTSVYSNYKLLILDGFLKFWCFSLDLQEWIQKLSFLPLWLLQIFGEKRSIYTKTLSFLLLFLPPHLFLLIIKLYLFSFLIIPPHNF